MLEVVLADVLELVVLAVELAPPVADVEEVADVEPPPVEVPVDVLSEPAPPLPVDTPEDVVPLVTSLEVVVGPVGSSSSAVAHDPVKTKKPLKAKAIPRRRCISD